jgi:branched-chain amino acid transport system substrate-binding protein
MAQPTVHKSRRQIIQGAAAAVGAMSFAPGLMAQAAPVRVGYAIARTGPWTGGAQVSQEPNYLLWAEQQNAAGGLDVKGVKRKIELISSDDRSDTETVVRTYEKLMGSDKVDLVLPPWGSNANFAVAPLANRFGYPFLAPDGTEQAADRDEAAVLLPAAAAARAHDQCAGGHAQGQRLQDAWPASMWTTCSGWRTLRR